jgi:hypothetical protein
MFCFFFLKNCGVVLENPERDFSNWTNSTPMSGDRSIGLEKPEKTSRVRLSRYVVEIGARQTRLTHSRDHVKDCCSHMWIFFAVVDVVLDVHSPIQCCLSHINSRCPIVCMWKKTDIPLLVILESDGSQYKKTRWNLFNKVINAPLV